MTVRLGVTTRGIGRAAGGAGGRLMYGRNRSRIAITSYCLRSSLSRSAPGVSVGAVVGVGTIFRDISTSVLYLNRRSTCPPCLGISRRLSSRRRLGSDFSRYRKLVTSFKVPLTDTDRPISR